MSKLQNVINDYLLATNPKIKHLTRSNNALENDTIPIKKEIHQDDISVKEQINRGGKLPNIF